MLGRVLVFANTYPQFFAKDAPTSPLIERIGAAAQKLSAHANSQTSSRRAVRISSNDRSEARAALRGQLETISRTARGLKLSEFWLPRNKSDRAIVETAHLFAAKAESLKQAFIDSYMPADFLEKLNLAIQNFEKSIKAQAFSIGTRLAATAAMDQARTDALSALESLDPLMENRLRDDPPTLAVWESARHLERYGVARSVENGPRSETSAVTPT